MKLTFLSLLAMLCVCASARADLVESHLTRVDGSEITYYFDGPATGSYPIILFLQGSECRSVVGRSNMPTHPSAMFNSGFLMIEKYGITKAQNSDDDDANCTPDFLRSNTLEQRTLDALRVVAELRKHEARWNHQFLLIGGSEGGMLAPILAALVPETKRVAMLVAGNGRTMLEDTREALTLTARKAGVSEGDLANLLAEYDVKTEEIRKDPSTEKMYLGHPYRWWNSVLWIKPVNWMLDLELPQLLVHGTADTAVPVESARASVTSFAKAGKSNLTYWEAPDCDHALVDGHGVSHKMEYLLKSIQWLLQ